jgi:hypothetical protein
MKANGDYELSDVPRLLQSGKDRHSPPNLLGARAALLDACEAIMGNAETSCRALTPDERRAFDLYSQQIQAINFDLAEYKRERLAGLVEMGIDPGEMRSPF